MANSFTAVLFNQALTISSNNGNVSKEIYSASQFVNDQRIVNMRSSY